jgi:zinc protease
MNPRLAFSRLVLSAFALALANAAAAWAAPPAGASGSVPDDVLRATLGNGLRVVIVPDRLAPVVTTEINYLAGSNDAPPGFPGTAHALEHMMFRGSDGLDRDQLAELSAELGGNYNADTTETVTQYFFTVPAADLPVALHIEALRMRGADLRQADWDQERGAIEQEVSRDMSSPIYTYLSQLQGIMFAGTPYAHDALGTRPSFDKTDANLLRSFYDRWYAPNNAILVIAGDVRPDQALAAVKAAFEAIPSRPVPAHETKLPGLVKPQALSFPTDLPFSLATIAYPMPGLRSPDFATADILSDILGSERGALYGMVPAGHALIAEWVFRAKSDVGYGLAAAAFPKGADPAPVLAEVRGILANIAAHGVSPDLLEAARRQELAQLAFKADSITGLAESWSQALAFQGLQSPDDIAHAYQAVTLDGVNALAKQLLTPGHAVTAILTPQDDGKPVAGKGFGGAESFGGAPGKPVALPAWASEALASLHLPDPGTPPDVATLPNGLRLIVQPEHVSHTVSVFGMVRQSAAMEEPKGQEGIASITSRLFNYGTQQHDRLGFQKALDDIAAQEQAGERFTLRVLTPEFEHGMALLAENELHPAFPAQAFDIVRRQAAESLVGLLQSPDYLTHRAIEAALVPAGDPTLRQATPETVKPLTLDALHAYYSHAYRPDLTTIVIAGDVSFAQARDVVARSFGAWQAQGQAPAVDPPAVPPSHSSATRVPDASSVQDSATLAETIAIPVSNPDRFVLMLGNTMLGSGFSSRLYKDLRVRTGYVYGVDSTLDWSRTRGEYAIEFGADPVNVPKARALALADIRSLQQTPVSDGELTRAKAETLRRLDMQRDSIDAIAGLYLRLVDLGLPLDEEQLAAKRYFDATAPDVQKAFQTWIRPDDLAEVVKGPTASQ